MPPQQVPAHQGGKAGWANTEDQIPEIVSEYLPFIFLGDLAGNLEAGGIKAKRLCKSTTIG